MHRQPLQCQAKINIIAKIRSANAAHMGITTLSCTTTISAMLRVSAKDAEQGAERIEGLGNHNPAPNRERDLGWQVIFD
jgi:hypothetical protein